MQSMPRIATNCGPHRTLHSRLSDSPNLRLSNRWIERDPGGDGINCVLWLWPYSMHIRSGFRRMTKTETPSVSELLGARASNAGDAFHELWALRSALALLIPRTELKAVTVEGIAAPASSGYQYDGADCALFYGDKTLETANKLEFLQLKYSTADPTAPWTVSRLTASSAKRGNNSVLRKLADTYANAKKTAKSGAEIIVRLVSNQPLADEVQNAVAAILADAPFTTATRKLSEATGLSGEQLRDFLKVLDFSQMGAESRSALQDALTRAVAEIIGDSADTQFLVLQSRIRSLMMPEAVRLRITLEGVLSWFSVGLASSLFPAPADLQTASNPIAREPARQLALAMRNGKRLICIDGPGGCGKTTTLVQAQSLLPKDSIAILFDCYGAGRYTHSNDRRHLPENAFLQIANDLAWAQGTPFLIAKATTNPANIRTFLERVTSAAKLLASVKSDAILAILIDAADNSVNAAQASKTECFVWEIVQADLSQLPANVRIVFSTRTARKSLLRLPNNTVAIPCPSFTRDETSAFGRSRLPLVSEDWIDQFQALSSGIPRVQSYAFSKGGNSEIGVLDALRPSGKKLDTVLRELFKEAATKSGDTDFYDRCVAALSLLPAPIPLDHLAGICRVSPEAVTDFVSDVQPSLRIEDDTVTIADEDVEDFLKSEAQAQTSIVLSAICAYFSTRFRTDAYAATHYCDFLADAARASEILPIIERDLSPAGISDPIIGREVQLRRLRLALAACRSAGSAPDTLKVIILSAEAAKDEDALRELLEHDTDLSVRFASASLFRLVLADQDRYAKQGSVLAQDAARAAYAGDAITARERINAYDQWMRRRQEQTRQEKSAWAIDQDDVVSLQEAIAILSGPKACRDQLMRWKPVQSWPRTAIQLIPRLIARGRRDLVESAYQDQIIRQPWSLLLTVPLALSGYAISLERLTAELSSLRKSNVPGLRHIVYQQDTAWELSFLELITTACEIAFSRGVQDPVVLAALNLILEPRKSPTSNITRSEALKVDIALRAWLLRQRLITKDGKHDEFFEFMRSSIPFPPKKRRGRKKKQVAPASRDRSDDEFKRATGSLFPVYKNRLDILEERRRGPLPAALTTPFVELGFDAYILDAEYWGGDFRRRAGQSIIRLMHIDDFSLHILKQQADSVTQGKYEDAFAARSLAIWQELLLRPSMHQTILDSVTARAEKLRLVRTGAKAKTEALTKFSRLVLNFSELDAKAIFERTIEIAQEIDREAMVQVKLVAALTARQDKALPDLQRTLAASHAAFVTDVAIRLEGEERFPWQEAVSAISDLSLETALAAISQWQDEGLANCDKTLPHWLVQHAAITHDRLLQACALLIVMREPSAEVFDALAARAAVTPPTIGYQAYEMLASHCVLHLEPGRREAIGRCIVGSIPRGFQSGPNLEHLKATVAFNNENTAKGKTKVRPDRKESYERTPVELPPTADLTTQKGMIAAINELNERRGDAYVPLSTILKAVSEKITSPAQRIPYLNALSTFDGDSLDADARGEAILSGLTHWTGPAIESWRTATLPKVISKNLWPLSRWLAEPSCKLVPLFDAANVSGQARIDAIASGLEAGADAYGAAQLFGLSELIAKALPRSEAATISEWYIKRLHATVPSDIKERYDVSDIPISCDHAISRFLFAQMSDIDVRIRWRSAHCVRQLVAHFGSAPLAAMFKIYNGLTERSYRVGTLPFYWMAARLWLNITAKRIAVDNPTAVAPIAAKLCEIAFDKSFPHFLIKANAKHTLETLLKSKVITLRASALKALDAVNSPKPRPVQVKQRYSRDLEYAKRKERRFKFDTYEVVKNWYTPLYRHFATLSVDGFFKKLDHWLIDKWKVDPKATHWDKEPRQSRFNDRDQMRSMISYSQLPAIERYGTHLEWHAMFCALDEWLKTEPLAVPEYESDKLEYWARNWDVTEMPTWLADRRTSVPLDQELIVQDDGDDKHWFRRIPKLKFLSALIGRKNRTGTAIVIEGEWVVSGVTRVVHVSVDSALVASAAAAALVKTVQTTEPYACYFPHESDDDETDIDVSPFQLFGWLTSPHHEVKLDDDDPLRRGVKPLGTRPARKLLARFKLKPSGSPKVAWGQSKQSWFSFATWGDYDDRNAERNRRRLIGTNGHRLHVDANALRTILATRDLDLIVKVAIERRLENEYERSSSYDEKKRNEVIKAFIFRKDGAIEAYSGRVGSWFRAGQGTGKSGGTRHALGMDGALPRRKNGRGRKSRRRS